MSGWLKLHREILDWEWYSDLATKTVFIHLLLTVNRDASTFQGVQVPRAGRAIGRKQLSIETGLSEQQVRRALLNLKTTSEITIKTTNKFSVVSINNWDSWQSGKENQPAEQPATQPQNNHKRTTVQEDNNIINTIVVSARARILSITKWDQDPSCRIDTSRLDQWLANGWDIDLDILPTVQRLTEGREAKGQGPPKTMIYFEQAIADANLARNQPLPKGKPNEGTWRNTQKLTGEAKSESLKQQALKELGVV